MFTTLTDLLHKVEEALHSFIKAQTYMTGMLDLKDVTQNMNGCLAHKGRIVHVSSCADVTSRPQVKPEEKKLL